jgi:hypothetical protein
MAILLFGALCQLSRYSPISATLAIRCLHGWQNFATLIPASTFCIGDRGSKVQTTQTERQALNAAIATATTATLTPAERRALQRRLERWELEHLRQHAAELAERLELAEQRADDAERRARIAEAMCDQWQHLEWERAEADGPTRIGLTIEGQLVAVPA